MNLTANLLAGVVMASCAGFAMGQDQVSAGGRPLRMNQISPTKMGLNAVDRKAMADLAIGHMGEIAHGKLAQQKGTWEWTRQFGKEMVMEHMAALDELKSLASKKGVTLPTGPGAKHAKMQEHLAMLNGAAFDSAYHRMMLEDHVGDEAMIRSAMSAGRDADVRGYEVKLLPQVVQHKRLVHLKRTMMGATKLESNRA